MAELAHDAELRFIHEWSIDSKNLTLEAYLQLRQGHVFDDVIQATQIILNMPPHQRTRVTMSEIIKHIRHEQDALRVGAGTITFCGHQPLLSEVYWSRKLRGNPNARYAPRTP